MSQVAVIMPVYKSQQTLAKSVASVINQIGVDFTLYLSVDGEEPGSYGYIKEMFPEVEILYSPVNGGPGKARQYGIDNTTEPFITFIDSDDLFNSLSALYTLYSNFEDDPGIVVVISSFLAEQPDGSFEIKNRSYTWMHGKMYRRSYLDEFKIRFNEKYTSTNEDLGFNTICMGAADGVDYRIKVIPDTVYIWKHNPNSIVRQNNAIFKWTNSIIGYTYNRIYAFDYLLDTLQLPLDDGMSYFVGSALPDYFKSGGFHFQPGKEEYFDHFMEHSKIFYREFYLKHVDGKIKNIEEIEKTRFDEDEHYEAFKKWKKILSKEKKLWKK